MMVFGLRSLSELLVPPVIKYKENALAALDLEVLAAVHTAVQKYGDDNDVVICAAKVMWGICEGLASESCELKEAFEVAGGKKIVEQLVNSTAGDDESLGLGLQAIRNLSSIGIDMDPAPIVPGILQVLKPSCKPTMALMAMSVLNTVATSQEGPALLNEHDALEKLLQFCKSKIGATVPGDFNAVEQALVVARNVAKQHPSTRFLPVTMDIIDGFKSKKAIVEKGSETMACFLGPEELKNCLKNLEKAEDGTPEKKEAMTMLSSLSYVSHFADEIVRQGGIPLLCGAIKDSSRKLTPDTVKGLTGAAKMMSAISAKPGNCDKIVKAGGVTNLVGALKECQNYPSASAAVIRCLANMVSSAETAKEVSKLGGFKSVLDTLQNAGDDDDEVMSAGLKMIADGAHMEVVAALNVEEAIAVVGRCQRNLPMDPAYQAQAFLAFGRLASAVDNIGAFTEFLPSCNTALADHAEAPALCKAAMGFFTRCVALQESTQALQETNTVEAVVLAMVSQQDDAEVHSQALTILEAIATETDVTRTLNSLEKALSQARLNYKACAFALATVNGLTQVPRLSTHFQHSHTSTILSHIKRWVEMSKFDHQPECIKKACHSVEQLAKVNTSMNVPLMLEALILCQNPSMKALIDRQDILGDSHSLIDILRTVERICVRSPVPGEEEVASLIDQVMKVMKKYYDLKKVNVSCINILCELCDKNPRTCHLVMQQGAGKHVIAYMEKVALYEDVQEAGFRFLDKMLKQDPELANNMRRNGAVQMCKAVSRRYTNNMRVKRFMNPVLAVLMPADELEREIVDNIQILDKAAKGDDMPTSMAALENLSQLTLSVEGSRIAARVDIGKIGEPVVAMIKSRRKKNTKCPDTTKLSADMCTVFNNVAQTRNGCANLTRRNGVANLVALYEDLHAGPSSEDQRTGVKSCLRAMRRLMRHDDANCEVAYKKGMVAKLCLMPGLYEEDPSILVEACKVLAAMKTDVTKVPEFGGLMEHIVHTMDSGADHATKVYAVEAASELLRDPSDSMVEMALKKGLMKSLLKHVDDYAEDPPRMRAALNCLDQVRGCSRMKAWFQKRPEQTDDAISAMKRVLKYNRNDPDVCAQALEFLNAVTDKNDRKLLAESGLMEIVSDLMNLHPNHPRLSLACGGLLKILGADEQIKSLLKQIISTTQERPQNWKKTLARLCNELAVFIQSDCDDPAATYKDLQKAMDSLGEACDEFEHDQLAAMAKVGRRLADKYWNEPTSPYGFKTLHPKFVPALMENLGGFVKSKKVPPKRFVCDAYRVLSAARTRPDLLKDFLTNVEKADMITTALHHLKQFESDPEIVQNIMEFLSAVAERDPQGTELIARCCKTKGRKGKADDFACEISALMNRHRSSSGLISAGMDLLAQLNGCPMLKERAFVKNLEELCKGNPDAIVHLGRVLKKNLKDLSTQDQVAAIQRFRMMMNTVSQDPEVTGEQKAALSAALADLLSAASAEALKLDGLDGLDQAAQECEDLSNFMKTAKAFKDLAVTDDEISARIARDTLGPLCGNAFNLVQEGNVVATEAALELLKVISDDEANARIVNKNGHAKALLTAIETMMENLEPEDAKKIGVLLEIVKKNIHEDEPEEMTLKKLYEMWTGKVSAGDTLVLKNAPTVMRHFDFLTMYTEDYAQHKWTDKQVKDFQCDEFKHGCSCFELLHAHAENTAECVNAEEPTIILKAIYNMKGDFPKQWPVDAALAATQHVDAAKVWSETENAAYITAEATDDGRKIPSSVAEREAMLINRMTLMERLALHRKYYNGTSGMKALIAVWDEFDRGNYSIDVLSQVFRTMRKIINDHFLKPIQDNKVPERLIAIVNDKNAQNRLLPDVLFLLGTLATVPAIKTQIGELGGVEACLGLLRRCLKNTEIDTAATQTNACLALANTTIGHGPNINRFVKDKGVELNMDVMANSMKIGKNKSKLDYDVANGAAVLVTNTCFKRNDMKEIYGKKGAVEYVIETIQGYDGSQDEKAFRCLGSMFKAMANLALFTPNIEAFCRRNVEETFIGFFNKSKNMPDWLVEVACRTVSNLVMENTEKYMTQFGKILEPILKMMQTQSGRTLIPMYCMTFDVLGCLSRLPANAEKFVKLNGIKTVLKVLNSNADEDLYSYGIFVLGVPSTDMDAGRELVKNGVFTFLSALFDGQASSDSLNVELTISALRCARRLIVHGDEIGKEFVAAGGVNAISRILANADTHAMVHMDAHRVLIALLANCPPPPPAAPGTAVKPKASKKPADKWDCSDINEEAPIVSAFDILERPPGPRSWERISLTVQDINHIVVAILNVLGKTANLRNLRMIRCALGLVAYFACEKVPGTVDSFYQGQVGQILTDVYNEYKCDMEIVLTGCYILNNVALASDPELYITLRRCKGLRESLDLACSMMKDKGNKEKSFCSFTAALVNERSIDPDRFAPHSQWEYPLSLTLWDKDKYPNGVQDLPTEMRDVIRQGNKCKTQIDQKTKDVFHWKASLDMTQIEWRIDPKEGPFPYSCAVSALKLIAKGTQSQLLKDLKGDSKLFNKRCMVVSGPPVDGFPSGFEWNLIFATPMSRDKFYDLLSEWREAATFGF
ncbi:MAG: uncharacterized protein KVP18_004735 [Porospora cf. gigantea A]|nr:MAG: hypothetical protein KVP18_004735 [Porospora cf. gigantea A]